MAIPFGEPNPQRYEQEVLLAEYNAHRQEIFKWQSYSNQAIGGYLAVLSILATIFVKNGTETPNGELPIALMYVSLALLYVLLQFRFMIASHVSYLLGNLIPLMRDHCPNEDGAEKRALQWEILHNKYRFETLQKTLGLFKLGIEAILYAVVIFGWLWFLFKYLRNHLCSTYPPEPCVLSLFYSVAGAILPILLLIWILYGFSTVASGQNELIKKWSSK